MKGWQLMKQFSELFKNLALLTQLGLSLIMPILLCCLLCFFLTSKFDIGGWVFIPGIFFGLGGSFMTGYKLYLSECKKSKKDSEKNKINFNSHI